METEELYKQLTPLQQRFVDGKLEGLTNTEAYLSAGGKASSSGSVRQQTHRMMTNDDVSKYLSRVTHKLLERNAGAIMSREEMMVRLSAMARTDVDTVFDIRDADEELMNVETGEIRKQQVVRLRDTIDIDPGALSMVSEITATDEGIKAKMRDPMAAMKQLADIAGYAKPTEQIVTVRKGLDDFYGDDEE